MNERARFAQEWERRETNFAELCRSYGVSRETGYKWVARYQEGGVAALADRSHVAQHRPHAMSEAVRAAVLALREARPSWGPKKLTAYLERVERAKPEQQRLAIPAASSVGGLLQREGLVRRRRRSERGVLPASAPLAHAQEPNDVWSADFKGWFRTGNGCRCEPLTMTDNAARFVLRLSALPGIDQRPVHTLMKASFQEYGLPGGLRIDNGSPFVTAAPGGLSRLSIWWLRLGIRIERIEPGAPQQNGRHERFHLSLVRDRLDYAVAWDLRLQQGVFAKYRREFNEERPHEALGMRTPAEVYRPSTRSYPGRVPEMEYGGGFQVRRVSGQGRFLWRAHRVALSPLLAGEWVGFEETDDELYAVYYGPVFLGWLDGWRQTFVREERAAAWAARLGAEEATGAGPGLHSALPCGLPPDGGTGLRSAPAPRALPEAE